MFAYIYIYIYIYISIYIYILHSTDQGSSSVHVSLDFSAAFDTIDHNILLSRLENVFGIHGLA